MTTPKSKVQRNIVTDYISVATLGNVGSARLKSRAFAPLKNRKQTRQRYGMMLNYCRSGCGISSKKSVVRGVSLCAINGRSSFPRHLENVDEADNDRFDYESVINRNFNARCFLAIEVENQVSHKHLMGGAINAAALGRIGLAIAWSEDNLRKFVRMRNYMLFLSDVERNTFDTSNLLVLTAKQLLEIINDYASELAC
jgi:hypothetical protein